MRLVIMIALLTLVGCANEWTHPSANQTQFNSDVIDCRNYANGVQRHIVPINPSPQRYDTTCYSMGATTNCSTVQNQSGDAFARAQQSMAQGGADLAFALTFRSRFRECMFAKNYQER